MKRKVSVCTLNADNGQGAFARLKQGLTDTLGSFDQIACASNEELASAVVSRASNGELAVVAASPSFFLKTKLTVIKSSSQKIIRNKTISEKLSAVSNSDPKLNDFHAATPQGAKVFATPDGYYSAMAYKCGTGLIIILPLENELTDMLLNGELGKMLSAFSQPAANRITSKKENVSDQTQNRTTPEKPQTATPSSDEEDRRKNPYEDFKKSVLSVIKKGKTVAIANFGSAKTLVTSVSSIYGASGVFLTDKEAFEPNKNQTDEQNIAECAKKAKESLKTNLGIAISSVYHDPKTNENYVFVAVADSTAAKTAKIFSLEGETPHSLIIAAMVELCSMLDKLTDSDEPINAHGNAENKPNKNKNPKLIALIAGITVAAVLLVCIIIAFFFSGKGGETQTDSSAGLLPVQNIFFGGDVEEDDDSNFYYNGGSAGLNYLDASVDNYDGYSSMYPVSFTVGDGIYQFTSSLTTLSPPITDIFTTFPKTSTSKTVTSPPTSKRKKSNIKPGVAAKNTSDTGRLVIEDGSKGTFVFTVYGWGHGVGMSQDGAVKMAKDGHSYKQILTHYYNDTEIVTDKNTPTEIIYGGVSIPIVEYLCKTAKKEIGTGTPKEAIKAQMVAIYTYAKYYDFDVNKSLHAYDDKYEFEGSEMESAAYEVLSMKKATDTPKAKYIEYNGAPCFACYFASAAGRTTSSENAWAMYEPYLEGGAASPETVDVTTVQMSAETLRSYIENYAKKKNITDLVLSENPADWLEILGHDGSYSNSVGYITKIRVGNKVFLGNDFREKVVSYKLRSHCFTFTFIAA